MALFWNLGFFHIPNYVFIFNKQKATAHVSSPFVFMATLYVSSPGDEWMATNLVSIVWKFTCWVFWRGLPRYQSWSRPASPPTHTWLIGSEALPRPHHLVMLERVGGDTAFFFHYSAYYYRPLILACYRSRSLASSPHNLANVQECHISASLIVKSLHRQLFNVCLLLKNIQKTSNVAKELQGNFLRINLKTSTIVVN